ncbi:MAG TPA: hypothetical protein VNS88_18090 [Nitrospiraceae bacterium]|nr:hypothetical protein [Nitrospiraceae bacterium]
MRTWVCWTHFDCEVNIAFYATEDECYLDLKSWLDSCDEDCGHNPEEEMTASEIVSALEYHWEELSWGIYLTEVPVVREQLTAERVTRPTEENKMPAVLADDLMARLESFSES